MKITNLRARKAFWKSHYSCMGLSPVMPYDGFGWRQLVAKHDVLEVGPGGGRQFDLVAPIAASMAVADIVPEVLAMPRYADAQRYLLKQYSIPRREGYDVVMCSYVLHHVLKKEGPAFVQMLADVLRIGGTLLLNAPDDELPENDKPKNAREQGIRCTGWSNAELAVLFAGAGLNVRCSEDLAVYNVVYVLNKL